MCAAPPWARPCTTPGRRNSLTSLCQLQKGPAKVWFCPQCGHLSSPALEATEEYYANDYKILLNHEEEDQIYEVVDGKVVYRTDHQLKVLNAKIPLRNGALVLDYGCAKTGMSSA